MEIPAWLQEATAWAGERRWIVWLVALPLVVLAVDALQRALVRRATRAAHRSPNIWDHALVAALGAPVSLALWVLGAAVAAAVVGRHFELPVGDYLPRATTVGLVLALAWFGLRLARGVEDAMLERYVIARAATSPDRTTIEAIGKVLRAVAIVAGLLVVLQSLGVSISGLIAVGGVGGLAIAFAARDLLANFFGSVMIHMDGPFKVGDWIRSPDREIEGVVEHIGWRISRVRSFDMRPLYIPNSVFTTVVVENPSRMSHRRVYETVGLRYDDLPAMGEVVGAIREMIEGREEVDLDQPVIVNFVQYGESAAEIMLYYLVTETRWVSFHALKQEAMLRVADIVREHGARVAFPTSTLHLASVPGGEPVEAPEVEDRDPARSQSADPTYGDVETSAEDGGDGG